MLRKYPASALLIQRSSDMLTCLSHSSLSPLLLSSATDDVVVATPSRLMQAARIGALKYKDVRALVIDEADTMLTQVLVLFCER